MRFAQTLIVSSFVLLSSTMLADVVLAESREPRAFAFSCTVPSLGKDRCGDADRNVRVGRGKRLLVTVDTVTPKPPADKEICFEFFAYHAVSGDQIGHVEKVCTLGKPYGIWANPKETPVDVFLKVGSDSYDKLEITGAYVVDHP